MSACDSCCSPGACCKQFLLNFTVSHDDWHAEAQVKLNNHGLWMLEPVRPYPVYDKDYERTQVLFRCTRLGDDGRCTIYADRPQLCRTFEPGSDALCVRRKPAFKGIHIVSGG